MIAYILFACLFLVYLRDARKALIITVVCYPTLWLFYTGKICVVTLMTLLFLLTVLKKYNGKRWEIPLFMKGITALFFSYLVSGLLAKEIHLLVLVNSLHIFLLPITLYLLYEPTLKYRQYFKRTVTVYLLVLVVYGVWESYNVSNPVLDYLRYSGMSLSEQSEDYIRFGMYRAQSLTIWCSAFGSACGIGLVYLLHQYFKRNLKANLLFWPFIALLAYGVVLSGTRTVIVMTCIAMFSLVGYFSKRNIKKFIPIAISLCVLYLLFQGMFQEIVESIVHHEDTEGSTLEMRQYQYAAAYMFFEQSPIIGNGLSFTSQATEKNSELLGAESIIFSIIIDRGIIGLLTFAYYIWNVVVTLYRKNCVPYIFLFLAFIFGKISSLLPSLDETWVLLCVIPLYAESMIQKTSPKIPHKDFRH